MTRAEFGGELAAGVGLLQPRKDRISVRVVDAVLAAEPCVSNVELAAHERAGCNFAKDEQGLFRRTALCTVRG